MEKKKIGRGTNINGSGNGGDEARETGEKRNFDGKREVERKIRVESESGEMKLVEAAGEEEEEMTTT